MSLSKILYPLLKVLVQPRKTRNRYDITEKLLLGWLHKASILVETGPYKDLSAKFGQNPASGLRFFFTFSFI